MKNVKEKKIIFLAYLECNPVRFIRGKLYSNVVVCNLFCTG